jgi:hypothetical protein
MSQMYREKEEQQQEEVGQIKGEKVMESLARTFCTFSDVCILSIFIATASHTPSRSSPGRLWMQFHLC